MYISLPIDATSASQFHFTFGDIFLNDWPQLIQGTQEYSRVIVLQDLCFSPHPTPLGERKIGCREIWIAADGHGGGERGKINFHSEWLIRVVKAWVLKVRGQVECLELDKADVADCWMNTDLVEDGLWWAEALLTFIIFTFFPEIHNSCRR